MTRIITAALGLGMLVATGTASYAHHAPSVLGTVRISEPVMAGGSLLAPGTYEVRLTGEHVAPLPGQSDDAVQGIEFVSNGKVVAHDAAEVIPAENVPVGTSGGAATGRFDVLKGGDFGRVSISRGGERYLIHLPVAN